MSEIDYAPRFGNATAIMGADDDLLRWEGEMTLGPYDLLYVTRHAEILRVMAVPSEGLAHVERGIGNTQPMTILPGDELLIIGNAAPSD